MPQKGNFSIVLSPELYRKVFKPRQKRLFRFVKGHTDARILLHNCGSVYRVIGDFIDIAVDALNPVQVSAGDMDPEKLKNEFGREITFWGRIDTHKVLPFETPVQYRYRKKSKGR